LIRSSSAVIVYSVGRYQATAKTSSLETLELFRSDSNAYDIVITDQTMPDMTGVQLAKELLKIRPDIPILICTGDSSKIDATRQILSVSGPYL